MNYIKQLQEENMEIKDKLKHSNELITDFLCYLNSNKFYIDTTIQSKEVYNRVLEIRNSIPL